MLSHCWFSWSLLAGRQRGIWPVKSRVLVCWWSRLDWSFHVLLLQLSPPPPSSFIIIYYHRAAIKSTMVTFLYRIGLPAVRSCRRHLSATKFLSTTCQSNHAERARARQMGVAELCNACSDWSTVKECPLTVRRAVGSPTFFMVSATNVGDIFLTASVNSRLPGLCWKMAVNRVVVFVLVAVQRWIACVQHILGSVVSCGLRRNCWNSWNRHCFRHSKCSSDFLGDQLIVW